MGYLNVPANGWPQLRDLEKLDKIAQQMGDLPTFTSNDRAFLEALPAMPTEEGKTVLTANTDNQGNTELTYETPEVEESDIAPAFSEEVTYPSGTLVYYEGILYKFTADHAAGAWDPSEVTPTSAAAEFIELKSEVDELKNTINGQLDTISSGITIFRIGRYRLLSLKGCVSDTSGNVANLSEQDRPSALNECLSFDNDGKTVCYIAISTSGVVAARTLAGSILTSNGIYGTISYYV